jgi:copper chaperone CopZ
MEFIQTEYLPIGFLINKNGDIKGLSGKIMKPCISNSGYKCIVANKKGKFIHRALAYAFIPKVEGKDFVNHKDGNKLNNSLDNLEWCTKSENSIHAYELGLKKNPPNWAKGMTGKKHNKSKEVCETDIEGNVLNIYGSMSEASRCTGIEVTSIHYSIKNGTVNKQSGNMFKYTHNENWKYLGFVKN